MPPLSIRFLDKRGITLVDLGISAIRFCRGLKLWARTNDEAIRELLEQWADDPEEPWLEAAIMRSSAARQGITSLSDSGVSVGLFVGQTELDLALVENGRLRQVSEVADQIAALVVCVKQIASYSVWPSHA